MICQLESFTPFARASFKVLEFLIEGAHTSARTGKCINAAIKCAGSPKRCVQKYTMYCGRYHLNYRDPREDPKRRSSTSLLSYSYGVEYKALRRIYFLALPRGLGIGAAEVWLDILAIPQRLGEKAHQERGCRTSSAFRVCIFRIDYLEIQGTHPLIT